ncbi:hypothetical protein [uncultured Thiodictyon sp.]|jgi:hypothetical protein|uniref:hypothetical protein n=1 Tax=uncultured Thiodictyon sp. TaxID=1846217 RepID=UPI0025D56449|nr:hypothetical protein [uncultured Thiodictyon sp.]
MIRIPDASLPAQANGLLEQYQAEVDGQGNYAARVAAAKALFSSRNKRKNPAFAELFAQAPEALAF